MKFTLPLVFSISKTKFRVTGNMVADKYFYHIIGKIRRKDLNQIIKIFGGKDNIIIWKSGFGKNKIIELSIINIEKTKKSIKEFGFNFEIIDILAKQSSLELILDSD